MGALSDLQRAAVGLLGRDEILASAGIVLVAVDRASALALAMEAQAGAGVLVAVGPPAAQFRGDSSVGPVADGGVTMAVQVSEPLGAARDQALPSALDLAERVAWLLHAANHAEPDAVPLAVASVSPVPDQFAVIYSILCRATLALDGTLSDPDPA